MWSTVLTKYVILLIITSYIRQHRSLSFYTSPWRTFLKNFSFLKLFVMKLFVTFEDCVLLLANQYPWVIFYPCETQNLPGKLGQQSPICWNSLGLFTDYDLNHSFHRNKTFLFFKIESWNFQHFFEKEFHDTSQIFKFIRQPWK